MTGELDRWSEGSEEETGQVESRASATINQRERERKQAINNQSDRALVRHPVPSRRRTSRVAPSTHTAPTLTDETLERAMRAAIVVDCEWVIGVV